MHLSTQETSVEDLSIGMYISRLDIPWVQTPFPLQGFCITKQEELELLAHYCNKVYVDIHRSKTKNIIAKLSTTAKKSQQNADIDPKILALMKEKARFKPRAETYQTENKLKKEIKSASQMYQKITSQMASLYQALNTNDKINIKEINLASTLMVKSIIKNPNALAWLCRVSVDNEKLHQQAVRSTIWALIFARHMGLAQSDLHDLGSALLLASIGKSKLSKNLLQKHLTEQEIQQYNEHVGLTLEETRKLFSSTHQINYIISSYCERNNGTGYPRSLVGNKIPFLARIAGLADYYEQLINPYNNDEEALTPVEAISNLYAERGNLFQVELVEEFIQAMGIYPTGSLVKLSDNSIGIVIEQPEKSRLRPTVAIIKDSLNTLIEKPQVIDLAKEPNGNGADIVKISESLISSSDDVDTKVIHQRLFGSSSWFSF